MLAESLTEVWETDRERGARRTGRLLELSRAALAEMRALLSELRESETDAPLTAGVALGVQRVRALGLVSALRHLGDEVSKRGLPVKVETTEFDEQPRALAEALYRIAQEALNNALKHSGAEGCIRFVVGGRWQGGSDGDGRRCRASRRE